MSIKPRRSRFLGQRPSKVVYVTERRLKGHPCGKTELSIVGPLVRLRTSCGHVVHLPRAQVIKALLEILL